MPTHARTTIPRRRRAVGPGLVAAAIACAALASGCGSASGGPQVASVAATTTAHQSSAKGDGAKASGAKQTFSACMRSHGLPNFPDANANGGIAIDASSGVDPSSPVFQAAQKACQKLAPGGGKAPSPAQQAKAQAQALKFSACMRSHGVANFPDPKFSGGMTQITIDSKSGGIDPNSPIFQAAQKTCQKLLPGRPDGPGAVTSRSGSGPASSGGSTQTGSAGK
jgi:hypothetical protein